MSKRRLGRTSMAPHGNLRLWFGAEADVEKITKLSGGGIAIMTAQPPNNTLDGKLETRLIPTQTTDAQPRLVEALRVLIEAAQKRRKIAT